MEAKTPKVLIVDDEPQNVRLLEEILTPLGVETYIASSKSQISEMLTKLSPDVILLEMMMLGMDGIELCRRLKEDPRTRNITVIFLAALTDLRNYEAAVEAGGFGFITKPIQRLLLETTVRSALRMKYLSDEVDALLGERAGLTHMFVHDINNLLIVSLGHAQLMLLDDNLPASFREDVIAIEQSSRDIREITTSLQELKTLESGTLPISFEAVSLRELVEQRANLLISRAEERHVKMELHKIVEGFIVQADRNILSRVLDNLILNAIKLCPDGCFVEISLSKKDNRVEVEVTNDGPPIPKEFHKKIFEKFGHIEVRKTSGHKGVGLGLAFCKMALEMMGGAIWLESPVDGLEGGTRFVASLCTASI